MTRDWWRRRWLLLAGLVAVAAFETLAGRFWHPYYGFTKFLQFEQPAAGSAPVVHEAQARPIYLYPPGHGYDGAMYAQIAFHPLLDSPELKPAIDSLSYRARRILGPAVAWLLAGGNPERIANLYAAENLVVWLVFAAVLWRLLPVNDTRSWFAWAALLFSSGVLHAVRLALTDLPAVTLLAIGMLLFERGRERASLGVLGVAALARETILLGVVAWWRGPWLEARAWLKNALKSLAVVVPLAAWMLYVRTKSGPVESGLGNFTLPVVGFVEKWGAAFAGLARYPQFRALMIATLLAVAGLTAQAVYIATRPRRDDPWWRIGAASIALLLLLGTAVWEGYPGAATRVLLPLSLAFTVLAVRQRASFAWLVLGALPVFSGVLALWDVPNDPLELGAGVRDRGAYVVRLGDGWYGGEHHRRDTWAWTAQRGTLAFEAWPRANGSAHVRVGLRAMSKRMVEVRQKNYMVWHFQVGPTLQWFDLNDVRLEGGRATLEFSSAEAPVKESPNADARGLGFAVYDAQLK